MAKKAVKCSKEFKKFLDGLEGKTYEEKILTLIKDNNPKAYKHYLQYGKE